jgi:hypothetical protein
MRGLNISHLIKYMVVIKFYIKHPHPHEPRFLDSLPFNYSGLSLPILRWWTVCLLLYSFLRLRFHFDLNNSQSAEWDIKVHTLVPSLEIPFGAKHLLVSHSCSISSIIFLETVTSRIYSQSHRNKERKKEVVSNPASS